MQGNSRLGTTAVVYLTKTDCWLASDSRDDFRGGRTSLLLPPGAENPSYATGRLHSGPVGEGRVLTPGDRLGRSCNSRNSGKSWYKEITSLSPYVYIASCFAIAIRLPKSAPDGHIAWRSTCVHCTTRRKEIDGVDVFMAVYIGVIERRWWNFLGPFHQCSNAKWCYGAAAAIYSGDWSSIQTTDDHIAQYSGWWRQNSLRTVIGLYSAAL